MSRLRFNERAEHIGSVDYSHIPGNPTDRKESIKMFLCLVIFGWFCLVGAWVCVSAVVDWVRGLG